jgi:tRNA-(ms[2]io[6]A)-hydroxylase
MKIGETKIQLELRWQTPESWKAMALHDLDGFLQDHAANERKVCGCALQLAVQHPTRRPLVEAMIDLAQEELRHFRAVYDLLVARGRTLGQDIPDPYMGTLRRALRKQMVDEYLLDRLVLYAIIEARGAERFRMMAEALPPSGVKTFYERLVKAEERHHAVYLELAYHYYSDPGATGDSPVAARLDELLDLEAATIAKLPLRPALH